MKHFDDIFSRKAKSAFDSYNADHLAGEGWNSFVGKYGKKRKLAIVIPLWAKAASIAVILTIGALYTYKINSRQSNDTVNSLTQESRIDLTKPSKNEEVTAGSNIKIASAEPVAEVKITKSVQTSHLILTTGLPEPDNIKAVEELSDKKIPDNPIETRLINDADAGLKLKPEEVYPIIGDPIRLKMTTTIMTGLSGMMASIDNTATTAQGVSFGFYVEQQLTRKISIRPGLAMAMHNYGIESASGGSEALGYVTPALDGLSGTTSSYEANIEVLSMEVPVNFVFSIWKRAGSNIFVSTGASTVIYLNQHLSGSFNNTYTRATVDTYSGEISYESKTSSVKVESDQEPFNRIDFLGLANFSAGYSLPFGKSSHLMFEPFVQLPIKDLTSLNLRIRYGGLSMKVKF